MNRKSVFLLAAALAASVVFGAGAQSGPGGTLTVAAAANISSLGDPLKAAFAKACPGVRLDFVFGASGALTTQIQNGAPYQVFMSADTGFPDKLSRAGLTAGEPVVYAQGALVLLSTRPLDFKRGLDVLKDPGVAQFVIANPVTAPYGKAAQETLEHAGLWKELQPKLVTAQTISQAVQFTLTAAGVGFVNKSALYTKELAPYNREGVNWIEINPLAHSPIEQAFVVLKGPAGAEPGAAAKAFADFLVSDAGRDVFARFGYVLP